MKTKPILIVTGETKRVFFEIFVKSLRSNNFKSPLLVVSSIKLFKSQMKKFKYKKKLR